MVEFIISSTFVLVPFMFMLTYMGKVGDVQHRAYEGARYAAWEKAITSKSDDEIEAEINKRILYGVHRNIDSLQDRQSANLDSDEIDNLFHHVNDNGDYEGLLVRDGNSFTEQRISNSRPDASAHRIRSRLLNSGIVNYDLGGNGMLNTGVSYELADTKWLDLPERLRPSASNVMYIENWKQVTHGDVTNAIGDSVFGARAFDNAIFDVVTRAAAFIGFEEFDDFEPGIIRPDVVPCSRVVGGGAEREVACY